MCKYLYMQIIYLGLNRMKIETSNNHIHYNMPDLEHCNPRPFGISLVSYLIKKSLIIL